MVAQATSPIGRISTGDSRSTWTRGYHAAHAPRSRSLRSRLRLTGRAPFAVLSSMPKDHVEVHLESGDFSTAHVQVGKLVGDEVISQLYRFDLDIVITDPDDVDPSALPGAELDI